MFLLRVLCSSWFGRFGWLGGPLGSSKAFGVHTFPLHWTSFSWAWLPQFALIYNLRIRFMDWDPFEGKGSLLYYCFRESNRSFMEIVSDELWILAGRYTLFPWPCSLHISRFPSFPYSSDSKKAIYPPLFLWTCWFSSEEIPYYWVFLLRRHFLSHFT